MRVTPLPAGPAFPAPASTHADGSPEGLNLSQLTEWLRCRYRWHLRHRRRIERRTVRGPMDLGSAVHAGMKAATHMYASFAKPPITAVRWQKMLTAVDVGIGAFQREWLTEHGIETPSAELEQQLNEIFALARVLVEDALERFDLDRWDIVWLKLNGTAVPLVEQKLTMPFLPDVPWYGTADLVARDRTVKQGGIWVIDYKCRLTLQPPEHEEVDLQLPSYQELLLQHDVKTVGSIKVQIRARVPQMPELNKDGSMSRAKIVTTWACYRQALVDAGLDPRDYAEMKGKLDSVEFLREDRIYRTPAFIQNIWDEIIEPNARLMVKSKSFPRNMHFLNCGGCWAREFCLGELRGEDVSFLLDTQYVDMTKPTPKIALRAEDFEIVEDA